MRTKRKQDKEDDKQQISQHCANRIDDQERRNQW